MNTQTNAASIAAAAHRTHVVAACLTILTREVHAAGLETQDALDLLRDAPDKLEAALTRGPGALVVYRLDRDGARGLVSDCNARLTQFADAAERDGASLWGVCPAAVAGVAAYVSAGAASLRADA
jgi:hypothetical protein